MSEIQFASINQYPKYNQQLKEGRNNSKRAQILARNSSQFSSTQPTPKRDRNTRQRRGNEKRRIRERRKPDTDSSPIPTTEQRSDSVPRKIYQWCSQCFGKKKSKISQVRKSQSNFFKRLRERCKKKKQRKKTTFKEKNGVSKTRHEDEVKGMSREERDQKIDVSEDPLSRKRRERGKKDRHVGEVKESLRQVRDQKIDMLEDPWTSERKRRVKRDRREDEVKETSRQARDQKMDVFDDSWSREWKKRRQRDALAPSVHSLERSKEEDQEEETIEGIIPDVGIDFTKSCCYLCAKNTMAIAAALSGKAEKFHMSIQASTKEILTSDKSVSPATQVRTVQSSVRVKVRDMGTLIPDKKKNKKMRPKLKIKKLNILPKLKFPLYPKVRTVACETNQTTRYNNIPQCRARRGGNCVTVANAT
ncbi:hypothetical protein WN48_05761 [Eufriesea mexicana]|uniref:Uncharacterized protein n=1 Tax=Eufriesea mexicana TaxID=516756 RepID=A0A310SI61_9HYME|nr:PREDICTED: DNA ligase 1-like [Eufriesea mexicana]OAD55012.1 hypothetical protein WN48_05761 [Eufriesea mexicana]